MASNPLLQWVMNNDYSAPEAARVLGISVATLYSYVSRGLLIPISQTTSRSNRYPREDVLRLAARKADAKRGGHMAVAAMNWGVPVLETRISRIADGQLTYRGHDAVALAGHATLEAAACLLWDDGQCDYFAGDAGLPAPDVPQQVRALAKDLPAIERAMVLLPLLAPRLHEPCHAFKAGPALMRLLAAILLDLPSSTLPLHEQLAQAWGADAEQAQLIRATLVLLADHELNASTFTVRCVASTGASLAAVLSAGLAALSGPKHGGTCRALRIALETAPSAHALADGYGHPLYPDGDPRAACLLERLKSVPNSGAVLARCEAAGQAANADLALAALEMACGWPPSAGMILFALARSAGWIAHAAEQTESGALIRPRARYVGRYRS